MARALAGWCRGRLRHLEGAAASFHVVPDRFFEAGLADTVHTDPETGIQIVLDARIDNLAALRSQVDPNGACSGKAELVLRAYQKYGDGFAGRILGEFAIIVWDGGKRRLLMTVDRSSSRPLFYRRHGDLVSVATEISSSLAEDFTPTLDITRMALWFAMPVDPRLGHFYREIAVVPGAHTVVLDPQGQRCERYWFPENSPDIRFRRPDEYVEACRELVTEAVRCRMPASLEVGCLLSGGLDSPIIAGTAADLLKQQGKRLSTFTAASLDVEDEREWKAQYWDDYRNAALFVRNYSNIDAVQVGFGDEGLMEGLDLYMHAVGMPPPTLLQRAFLSAIGKQAQKRRVGVMLDGFYGNGTVSYAGKERLLHLFRRGRWIELLKQWRGLLGNGYGPAVCLAWTFGSFLPESIQWRLRTILGRGSFDRGAVTPLAPSLASDPEFMRLYQDALQVVYLLGCTDRKTATLGWPGISLYHHSSWYRQVFGMDMVAPFSDPRIIEFCAGLPVDQYLDQGESRHLARRLLRSMGAPAPLVNEPRHGMHMAGWRNRTSAARQDMLVEMDFLENSPGARAVLDVERLRAILSRDLPTERLADRRVHADYTHTLPRGMSVGRFIRRMERGNR
jgi:asparagine synthase (glutamine-hydrolysing)